MSVANKTIIITGASRGIGEAAARALADAGANVVLTARSADAINAIAADIGPKAQAIAADVSDYGAVKAVIDHAQNAFGSVDVLVNNAGLLEPIGRLADVAPDAWDKVIDVNVKGVFYGMHAAIPVMMAQGAGTIINISSGAAYNVLEGWSHYCASKAAVLQLTRSGDKEYGDTVTVVGLSPGTVDTEMQVNIKASGMNPVSQLDRSDHIPASDVAKAIEYLCGPGGQDFKGQDLKLREHRKTVGLEG